MRIFTPLRPIISETNQFLRFLRLIQLALNETKSSNSECRQWVSIPRPTRMLYAARGHILELHVYYKNCTVTRQVAYTRGQRFRPRRRCWLYTKTKTKKKKKRGHTWYKATKVILLLPMLTPKRWTGLHQRHQEHVTTPSVPCESGQLSTKWHTPVLAKHKPTAVYDLRITYYPVPVYHCLISTYFFSPFNSSVSTAVYISGAIIFLTLNDTVATVLTN